MNDGIDGVVALIRDLMAHSYDEGADSAIDLIMGLITDSPVLMWEKGRLLDALQAAKVRLAQEKEPT